MAIFTEKLVQSKVLQDYLVDKTTAQALSAGVVTLYEDDNRTVLKNWYYQTGVPGNYTYQTLPNPMTLSAVGTMCDANGNDIIPLYYPFDENDSSVEQLYYITVDNSDGQRQFTRQGFPFMGGGGTEEGNVTLQNYIVNGRFWRHIGQDNTAIDLTNVTQQVMAPSQHDGFSMPDFQFIKNTPGAVDTATFKLFPVSTPQVQNDIQGEYYLNHVCTTQQVGETSKYYQIPISLHLATLELQQHVTVTIQTKSSSDNPNPTIQLNLLSFTGTSAATPEVITPLVTIDVQTTWQKTEYTFTIPSNQGLNLSVTGDDAYYLQIGLPAHKEFDLSFALPSIYLSSSVPINDFQTYDQINAIISSPRTGDFRTSLNSYQPFGWVAANDGTIGLQSTATSAYGWQTWQLYNLLWSSVSDQWAPVSGGRGLTAYADFNANKNIALTKNLGRVIQGLNPIMSSDTFTAVANVITFTRSGNNLVIVGGTYTAGQAVMLTTTGTLPAPLAINTVYYISASPTPTAIAVELSTTYANAIAGENITLTTAGSGTNSITTTNQFTLATSQLMAIGTPVTVSSSSALPNGLLANTVYYVSSSGLTATTFNLSFTVDEAQAGLNLPITTAGSGTLTLSNPLGATFGQGSNSSVPSHRHHFVSDGVFAEATPGNLTISGTPSNFNNSNVIGDTKYSGSPFITNMQPTVGLNVFIKL